LGKNLIINLRQLSWQD